MKAKNAVIASVVSCLALFTQINLSAFAQEVSSCKVSIVGAEIGSQVNMRIGPGTRYKIDSYVLVGQVVSLVLDDSNGQYLKGTDFRGADWYFVEYTTSGTRGWIREDFVGSDCIRSYM
jgi:uncharacterized protein YgiM (DUF1202 family)